MSSLIKFFLPFSILIASCGGPKVEFTQDGANYFGAEISDANAVSVSTLEFGQKDTLDISIKGTIHEVCQAKGCWMTIEDDNAANSIFIRFKDYAFFVPKDAGGKNAVVKGKLYNNVTSVEELQHYAKDKGQSEEEIAAITMPENEMRMMAEGVIIYNN